MAILKLPDGRYAIRWRDSRGARHYETLPKGTAHQTVVRLHAEKMLWKKHVAITRRMGPTKIGSTIDTPRTYGGGRHPDSDATHEHRERLLELKPYFNALLWSACRLSELRLLRWEDVDLRAGFVRIPQSKTAKAKTIPIGAEWRADLEAQPRGIGKAYVFASPGGEPYSKKQVERAFAIYRNVSGVREELTCHSIRHTVASWLAISGRNVKEIQELLGHATLAMTMRYMHLAPTHLRAAVDAIAVMRDSTTATTSSDISDEAEQ